MREIKFRGWLKEEKKLGQALLLQWLMLDSDQPEELTFEAVKVRVGLSTYTVFPHEVELMQYTGLKDKNGVEIYEGDIVIKTDRLHEGVEPFTGVVVYEDAACSFGIRKGTEEHNVTGYFDDTRDDYEVIGNIYENPELLPKP